MLAWSVALLILSAPPARAWFQKELLRGKSAASPNENVKWNLADWLAQKNKIALADQWLAAHRSQRIAEAALSAAHSRFWRETVDDTGSGAVPGDAMAYSLETRLSLLSLTGEYAKWSAAREDYGAAAGLVLLGQSLQSTHLSVLYGWHRLQDLPSREKWERRFAEARLDLYITRALGLSGRFRNYFEARSNHGRRLIGQRSGAGVFVESGGVRLFADYALEPQLLGQEDAGSRERREGYEAGLRFHF